MNTSFSIIIITHNREVYVKKCIKSVKQAMERYHGDTELIVVDSSKIALNLQDEMIQEIYVPEFPKPYQKRNIGAKASKYEWLIYLDDDCIVDKNILRIFNENVKKADENVGGFYGVTEFTGDTTYASRCCKNSNFTNSFKAPLYQKELAWGVAVSPLFRKKALLHCQGFTTEFTSPVGGEDLDLGVKLNEDGWILKGIPKTVSYHGYETWNSYSQNLKRFFRYGMAETSIVRNHPQHTFLKLNCLVLLLIPIILDLCLCTSNLWYVLPKFGIYFAITTFCSAVYYMFNNKVSLFYTLGLVLYDRAFEVGVLYSAILIRKFSVLFHRFEYQKKRRIFGHNTARNVLIAVEWLSIVLCFVLNQILFR